MDVGGQRAKRLALHHRRLIQMLKQSTESGGSLTASEKRALPTIRPMGKSMAATVWRVSCHANAVACDNISVSCLCEQVDGQRWR